MLPSLCSTATKWVNRSHVCSSWTNFNWLLSLSASLALHPGLLPKRPLWFLRRMCRFTTWLQRWLYNHLRGILEVWLSTFTSNQKELVSQIGIPNHMADFWEGLFFSPLKLKFTMLLCAHLKVHVFWYLFISPILNLSPVPLGNHQPTIKGGGKMEKLVKVFN